MGIKEEITKIAVEQGYEGAKPKSIAQAIDALTDMLAGEDVTGSRSIADAIHALAPYIGTGGGGGELGARQLISSGYKILFLFASDEPMTLGQPTPANAKFVMQNGSLADNIDVSVPEGLYVIAVIIVDTGTPKVVGVDDATVTQAGSSNNWVVQFRMPGNTVSIKDDLN